MNLVHWSVSCFSLTARNRKVKTPPQTPPKNIAQLWSQLVHTICSIIFVIFYRLVWKMYCLCFIFLTSFKLLFFPDLGILKPLGHLSCELVDTDQWQIANVSFVLRRFKIQELTFLCASTSVLLCLEEPLPRQGLPTDLAFTVLIEPMCVCVCVCVCLCVVVGGTAQLCLLGPPCQFLTYLLSVIVQLNKQKPIMHIFGNSWYFRPNSCEKIIIWKVFFGGWGCYIIKWTFNIF